MDAMHCAAPAPPAALAITTGVDELERSSLTCFGMLLASPTNCCRNLSWISDGTIIGSHIQTCSAFLLTMFGVTHTRLVTVPDIIELSSCIISRICSSFKPRSGSNNVRSQQYVVRWRFFANTGFQELILKGISAVDPLGRARTEVSDVSFKH